MNHPGHISAIKKQRREQIILAAIASLAELGYMATSFAEIGRRVGISKSVVAYHFKTKELLIDAVVNAIYDKGFEVVRPAIDAEVTAGGQIGAFIKQSLFFYREYNPYVAALGALRLHLNQKGKPNMVAVARLHQELADLSVILQKGQETGEFREFSPAIMARTLRQALDGALIEMAHHQNIDTEKYAQELTMLFRRALQK